MDKLSRIKSIDNFRFFSAYKWNNKLKPFERFNLIYGWNGCGKSTLSDFFHSIEIGEGLPEHCSFQLCFQSERKPESLVTIRTVSTVAHRFKVYHQGYVQGLISHPDNIKHISIIGHDAGEAVIRIDELRKKQASLENELNHLKMDSAAITREFESYRGERANLVRSVTSYKQSYNYIQIYNRYKQIKSSIELTQAEYDRLIVSVRAAQKARIEPPSVTCLSKAVCDDILAVLLESPVFTVIETLQENTELRNWVQRGYEIHKHNDDKICQFCHNPISSARWRNLEDYFNDSLIKFKQHINTVLYQLKNIQNHYREFPSQLPHATQFFDEFFAEYEDLKARAIALCEKYTHFIDEIIELVERKNEKIIDTQCAVDFTALLEIIDFDNSIFQDIGNLIEKHNIKAEDFRKSIAKDEEKLELHIISQSVSRFAEYETSLAENSVQQKIIEDKIASIKTEIRELDSQVKNSRIPAETINTDISFIFGHSDLHFEWKENGYEIRRNNEIATYLSTGEQNAIALIYFFNSLQDSNVSIDNCIIILDDPISSFDSNYYYSAAAYIRDKLQSVGQTFIFTHKFSLYKDFSRMFSQECHRYLLERENNMPIIKEEDPFLRDYQDEYIYLFHKIYHFTKNPPDNLSDYLPYPNMGRRLIEGFTSFKLPGTKDILSKSIELDGKGNTARVRAITRLMQNQSHLRLVGAHEGVENILDIRQLPEIFQYLLDFIKAHDPIHYETLVRQVDPEVFESHPELPTIIQRIIPLYDLPVSAGLGNLMDTYEPSEPYTTTNSNADFALKISGNSMEPQYTSGDIVLIKKQNTLENAQIGIVAIDGEVFCKKIITSGKFPLLVSLNSEYPIREVVEGERFEVLGIVIGKE